MNYSQKQEIAQAIDEVLEDAEIAQQLAAQARPAVWLQTHQVDDEASIALGLTKLGGRPDLPAALAWPQRVRYPDHHQRVKSHKEDSAAPDSRWRWAKPEQAQAIREEALQHIERLENPFPLNFLAQINFAQLRAAGPVDEDFPQEGVLSVFFDLVEQPWGYDPADACAVAVLFHEDAAMLERRDLPPILQGLPEQWQTPALACELHACCTPLPMESAQWESLNLDLSDAQNDAFVDWWLDEAENGASTDGEDAGCHRVGGWPTPVQSDMQTQCALVAAGHYCGNAQTYSDPALQSVRDTATDWLLLLQIGSDEKGGLNWGDDGQFYLWIRRDDLRERRFERARMVLQCH
ncbi:DUF1963 domain-containing protein [Comamonas sp. Y33R10-2]|uniref:YwqG family protein n=1 Tax=Comamonas sp. Y33R10-2 TaxID=2853257 RepID=UPI001C5CA8AB|nr:YwqG family protein [Comamonas sp. Y33R10-2]QXZ08927.1 DUF1963 domain-containing protein [Comamonas sp. Y33R10-2]